MSVELSPASGPARRSFRFRFILLAFCTGVLPFALALLLAIPLFRREISEGQGAMLSREAGLLAAQVGFLVRDHVHAPEAPRVVECFRRGIRGRAYLCDARGRLLSSLTDLPPIPGPEGLTPGWTVFEVGRASYFGGVARVFPNSLSAGSAAEPWYVAVVQPESEVMAPFRAAVLATAFSFGGLAGLILLVSWRLGELLVAPLRKLRQDAEIVSRISLAHRIDIRTGDELEGIATEFNRMAESLQTSCEALEERVRDATWHLSEERNRLAAVLRTISDGVILASEEGTVVLMTPRARLALGAAASSGIGAPLSGLLPAERLRFHVGRVRRAWKEDREPTELVVFPLTGGRVLRGALSGVRGPTGELAAFLLVFRDLADGEDEWQKSSEILREIPNLLKGPAATLQALVDVVGGRPDMAEEKRRSFLRAIGDEASRLAERLRTAEAAAHTAESSRWPRVPSDPGELLIEAVGDAPGVRVSVELGTEEPCRVEVEPYSWIAVLSAVLRWLRSHTASQAVEVSLALEEDAVVFTFGVNGSAAPDPSRLGEELIAPAGEEGVRLDEIVAKNRAEMWTRRTGHGFEVRLAVLRSAGAHRPTPGIADEQPEFYDFDLFLPHPTRETAELLATPLGELEYVVFDTETTGLNPSEGDEIVSLSAVRIRRGRIVAADTFHTLVNPCRHIPESSTGFHGIDDSMIGDAPTLDKVLPQFESYAGDSVLVAHNAAFDKKFLDLAATRYRMAPLQNPLLDTLLLSYGLHRDFEGHNLDAIAQRLGVEIRGRHTSLGDARATAEIFLRLVSLLSARGIGSLAAAKAFCDQMLLFRWQTSRY